MTEPTEEFPVAGTPERRPATLEVRRYAGMLFVVGVAVLGYEFAFQLTKPSPVARGTTLELLQTVAYVVLLPAALATLTAPLAVGLDAAVRARSPRIRTGSVPLAVVGVVVFVGLLSFAQNLTYSAYSRGLTSSDAIATKIIFGVFAGAIAAWTVLRLARTADRVWFMACTAIVALGLPALGMVTAYLLTTPEVAPLDRVAEAPQLNVIVLSSDAVEAEHLSAYGYERPTTPFLADHVDEFMRFENAFTNNGNTTGSITALLTGRSPLATRVVYPPDQLGARDARLSLPFLLARSGYRTDNWAVPHYADARDQNLAQAFDLDNDEEQRGAFLTSGGTGVGLAGWFVRHTLGTQADLLLDVAGIREMTNPYAAVGTVVGNTITDDEREAGVLDAIASDGPFFVNTHFMETHGPRYRLTDPQFSAGQEQSERWETDFYDDSLRLFDARVEAVYRALERADKLDDTIMVVTSDHGIDYDVTKRVPLLIRLPAAAKAGSYPANVERIDVAPTILEALGFEPPDWMTGTSLMDPTRLPEDREIVATSTSLREFANNQGFHAGAGDVAVTAIRCGWFVQRDPRGGTRTGTIEGSTSTCTERPEVPPPY